MKSYEVPDNLISISSPSVERSFFYSEVLGALAIISKQLEQLNTSISSVDQCIDYDCEHPVLLTKKV